MYCGQCGYKLADGSKFCGNCGTKQINQNPLKKQNNIPKDSKDNKLIYNLKKEIRQQHKLIYILPLIPIITLLIISSFIKNFANADVIYSYTDFYYFDESQIVLRIIDTVYTFVCAMFIGALIHCSSKCSYLFNCIYILATSFISTIGFGLTIYTSEVNGIIAFEMPYNTIYFSNTEYSLTVLSVDLFFKLCILIFVKLCKRITHKDSMDVYITAYILVNIFMAFLEISTMGPPFSSYYHSIPFYTTISLYSILIGIIGCFISLKLIQKSYKNKKEVLH